MSFLGLGRGWIFERRFCRFRMGGYGIFGGRLERIFVFLGVIFGVFYLMS